MEGHGAASDPYLCTGFDKKRLTLTSSAATKIHIEADFTGTGTWSEFTALGVQPDSQLEFRFPAAFGAYWLRLVSDSDTTASAVFTYE